MAITIHELAIHRGLKTAADGSYSGEDIAKVGLALIGGCEDCGGTIAAYNAYPARTGSWRCEDCIGSAGWGEVAEANRDIFGEADPPKSITVFNDSELATILHGLRMIQEGGRIEGCTAAMCDHFDEAEMLGDEEIDALCERLNLAPEQPKEGRSLANALKAACPWLGTDDEISGADAIEQIAELYDSLQEAAGPKAVPTQQELAYIAQARNEYASDEIEIDDGPDLNGNFPKVSASEDGAFVAAWVWVAKEEVIGEEVQP